MQPRQWSSTYNEQYRDRRRYVAPYAGSADSHIIKSRTQGYYAPRAALAEHSARTAELQARGLSAPFSSTTPLPATSRIDGSQTARSRYDNGYDVNYSSSSGLGSGSFSSRGGGDRSYGYERKDLWTHPILPHTGVYNNKTTIRGGVRPSSSSTLSNSSQWKASNSADILIDDPQVRVERPISTNVFNTSYYQNQNDTRYDSYGVAQTKYVDITTSSEPKNKYHIPGYSGNVRGMQFVHGDTYGKTTRKCLDVPNDVPQDGY